MNVCLPGSVRFFAFTSLNVKLSRSQWRSLASLPIRHPVSGKINYSSVRLYETTKMPLLIMNKQCEKQKLIKSCMKLTSGT